MQNSTFYLSIVIPAYNEERNLSSTLKDISRYLQNAPYNHEIIVVDDGSIDKTVEIAKGLQKDFPSFSILQNTSNRGKGYSIKRGMLAAKGELVLFMDADNATRIDQLDKLKEAIKTGLDAAIGSRCIPGAEIDNSQPLYRIILGNIYILLSKLILGGGVKDYNCGFKLFTKETVRSIFPKLTRNDWSFDSELIYLMSKFGLKIKEVPIRWRDIRPSKVRPLRDGINSFLSLLKIRLQAMMKVYGHISN